jgi:hypothetical protein
MGKGKIIQFREFASLPTREHGKMTKCGDLDTTKKGKRGYRIFGNNFIEGGKEREDRQKREEQMGLNNWLQL